MGPGRVTSTAGGSMTTWELWHCLTQHSLQLLASGQGPQGWQQGLQGWHCWHFSGQDMSGAWRCSWHTGQGGSRAHAHLRHSSQGTPNKTRPCCLPSSRLCRPKLGILGLSPARSGRAQPGPALLLPGLAENQHLSPASASGQNTRSPLCPHHHHGRTFPEEQGAGRRAGELSAVLER